MFILTNSSYSAEFTHVFVLKNYSKYLIYCKFNPNDFKLSK